MEGCSASSNEAPVLEYVSKNKSKTLLCAGHRYTLKRKYISGACIWECVNRKKLKCSESITICIKKKLTKYESLSNMEEKTAVIRMDFNVIDREHTKLYRDLEHFSLRALQNSASSGNRYIQHDYQNNKNNADKATNKTKDKDSNPNNDAYYDNPYIVFRKCTMYVLIWGQIIGLFPVLGLLEKDPSKIRFTMYSGRFIYSMFIWTLQTICAFLNLIAVVREASTINYGHLPFSVCVCITTLLFIRAASKWPSLVKELASLDLDIDPRVKVKAIRTFSIIFLMGILEHILKTILSYTKASDCHPDAIFESVMQSYFGFIFEQGIQFNVSLGILLQFTSVICNMGWNYSDLFVICISVYLKGLLDEICKKIRLAKNKDLPSSYWKRLRQQYTDSTKLVRLLDDLINATIFLNFACTLFVICYEIFNILRFGFKLKVHVDCPNYPSGPFGGYEHAVYFIYSSSFLIARVILMTLFASSVHTASLNIGPELYEVPSSAGNEINRFIEQVHGETVALTGYQFFNMTRGIVLSIAGTIVTYELVLMQFNE